MLAVLACGLYLSRQSSTFFSPNTRLQANSFWTVLIFLFNGLVFILLGLQLRGLLEDVIRPSSDSPTRLIGSAALITLVVIAVRLTWIAVVPSILRLLARFTPMTYPWSGWRNAFLVGWAGMRGAVSLAAALALPDTIAGGRPFPARDLLIVVTFGVILFTLVGQGLSLTPLIRALGVQTEDEEERELRAAWQALTQAALARLEEVAEAQVIPGEVVADQREHLQRRLDRVEAVAAGAGGEGDAGDGTGRADAWLAARQLRQELVRAERSTLIRLRNQGEINDEVLRRLERDLDLEEQQLSG